MSSPYLRKLITDDVDALALEYRLARDAHNGAECAADRVGCLREMQLIRAIAEYRFGREFWFRACSRAAKGEGG